MDSFEISGGWKQGRWFRLGRWEGRGRLKNVGSFAILKFHMDERCPTCNRGYLASFRALRHKISCLCCGYFQACCWGDPRGRTGEKEEVWEEAAVPGCGVFTADVRGIVAVLNAWARATTRRHRLVQGTQVLSLVLRTILIYRTGIPRSIIVRGSGMSREGGWWGDVKEAVRWMRSSSLSHSFCSCPFPWFGI